MKFSDLKQKYLHGDLARDDFWRLASNHHRSLLDYSQTLQKSDVQKITITKEGLFITLNNGIMMQWNPTDIRGSANTLINHGEHEAQDSLFLFRAAQSARYIFDIGANAGYYALHFGKNFPTVEKVHAFEPIPSTFDMLTSNVMANHLAHVIECHPCGLGSKNEDVVFYVPEFSGSVAASMQNLHPEENNRTVTAKITTLDEFCQSDPISGIDLIKMDVEGAEYFTLRGAQATIKRFKPILFIEILRKWSRRFGVEPSETFDFLRSLGYDCWAVTNGHLTPFSNMTEETVQTNFFFVHRDRLDDAIPLLAE